jgi:hypothetical protein
MKLISRIHTALLYPMARVIVEAQSAVQRVRSIGKKADVRHEAPYGGERILLLALYEKGVLRPDILRLLAEAKAQGLYVLAVNTLRLKDPGALTGLIDCYIERPNFGRDFGSYKTGFLHVFDRGWDKTCPRLLMVNDSVFFSETRLGKFLDDLMTSDFEVLGATENFEIEYHIGSFCIAMAQPVLQKPLFHSYWRKFRLTDVRPLVIRRGEMKLSRTLKRCVSSPEQFTALYSSARYYHETLNDPSLLDFSIRHARTSDVTPALRLDAKSVLMHFEGSVLHDMYAEGKQSVQVETTLREANSTAFATSMDDLRNIVKNRLADFSEMNEEKFRHALHSAATELFMRHSQIHQNAATLLRMGLPIIKLDLIYRGMASIMDMTNIVTQLTAEEGQELSAILMSRPYGEHVLFGWKRAAFMRGLI